ncbi:septal ring lytic transglycosylase RlpA family protein [Phormidium sp. FACHB-1136]|uniref:septal ring lytic transglycosylase RlpA family protein n=1 Tax=Phormidium sp. FACHB-1136 TaxID=2692848 RepID=UPI001684F4CA|nr:septal ring lytic transglycosylase RlpA family protein [Phormidium sp. FACHB-1136]MBD2426921.1 septal ring lytic transglycosylase RlpA family protein [Phormidium sp. FACHB-1136]
MKQSVLGGLTAAVILSTFGAPLPSHAQSTDDPRRVSESEIDAPLTSAASVLPEPATTASSAEVSAAEAEASDVSDTSSSSSSSSSSRQRFSADLVAVLPHALDANQAATVYLRSIPVITLIGDELATLGESKATPSTTTEADRDPVDQANEIVDRLLALAETEDPADIEARWLADQQAFVVAWEDEVLVTVNDQTILPDTTQNPAEDVLQMANRMRRLLGNAPALSRVEGMPEPVQPAPAAPQVGIVTSTLTGTASWYGPGFHGRRSASGEVFNQNDLTAAHRTLPFGTRVRVTNLRTGQQVIVRINDRGPFSRGRIIDLSAAAAGQIGLRASGVGQVQVEVLSNP